MANVRRAIRESWDRQGVTAGDVVSVAVSGGPDSLALAGAAIFEGKRAGVDVSAVIVNHNLQKGSMEVAQRAKETLLSLGFETVEVMDVQVKQTSIGMEAAARNARYGALDAFAKAYGAKFTMLGHTLDDQAETVLLGLARGSGAKSIAGMQELSTDGNYLRPLLEIRRATTVAFCSDSGIKVWNDPQNKDTKFSRVKVRLKVLPVLEKELGPGIAESLAKTAGILQEDLEYLDAQAEKAFKTVSKTTNNSVSLDVKGLEKLSAAIRNRVILKSLALLGTEPAKVQIDSISALVTNWHGQKPLALPSVRVVRAGNEIILKSTKTLKPGAC